jgi:hypothetical protein
LLKRANVHSIPTQVFINESGQGMIAIGAMTAEELRQQLQALTRGGQ